MVSEEILEIMASDTCNDATLATDPELSMSGEGTDKSAANNSTVWWELITRFQNFERFFLFSKICIFSFRQFISEPDLP